MKIPILKRLIHLLCISIIFINCKNTETVIKQIYDNTTKSDASHKVLEYLSKETPGRLPGTRQSNEAIIYLQEILKNYGADSVWLVPVMASGWKENKKPVSSIVLSNNLQIPLNAVSLGQCISTSGSGIDAPVVVIDRKTQIDSLGESGLKGKIVFFNGKMKVRNDYGKWAWSRTQGASMVSKYGAIGVLVRSLTTKYDDNPHAGVVRYEENIPKIPAVALSWQAADSLENALQKSPDLMVHLETFCENPGNVQTYNVVGEIRGSQYPDEILFLSAHLDSWHNTQGAHDDGGGVSQIIDVIRIFKELNIKPKRTIRVMPYMDEEQYNNGMIQYAEIAENDNKTHIIRIEVDHGIGVPIGFSIQSDSAVFTKQHIWRTYLDKYNLKNIRFSGNYSNSAPLYAKDKTILGYLTSDDPHYFDYHHSANDLFETVDKKNLQSGGAALAVFYYILDQMDIIDNSNRKN